LLLAILAWPASAEDPEPDLVGAAKQIYAQHLEKYRTEADAKLETWPTQYLERLSALREATKKQGDLDGWTTTDAEIKRFEEQLDISDADLVKAPASLLNLQRKFQTLQRTIIRDKNRNILTLTDKYAKRLKQLEVELTKKERIDDALRAREEKQRVLDGPAVVTAQFELAAVNAESGNTEAAGGENSQSSSNDRADAIDVRPERRAPQKVAGYDPTKFRVLDGAAAPAIEGMRFKKLLLKNGKSLRVGRKLSADAELGVREEVDETEIRAARAPQAPVGAGGIHGARDLAPVVTRYRHPGRNDSRADVFATREWIGE
jgi:hypothetical protein